MGVISAALESLLERLRLVVGRLEGILDRLGGILGRLGGVLRRLGRFTRVHGCARVCPMEGAQGAPIRIL